MCARAGSQFGFSLALVFVWFVIHADLGQPMVLEDPGGYGRCGDGTGIVKPFKNCASSISLLRVASAAACVIQPILLCCRLPPPGRGCKREAEALTKAVGPTQACGPRASQITPDIRRTPRHGRPKLTKTTWNRHLRRCRCCSAGHRSSRVGASIRSDAAAPHGSVVAVGLYVTHL